MGLIKEDESRGGGVGRSPRYIGLNGDFSRFCGVDLTSYKIRMSAYDLEMEKIFDANLEMVPGRDLIKKTAEILGEVCLKQGVKALGVALPGIMDRRSGILINSAVEELEGRDVEGTLRNLLEIPVYGMNDANVATFAEFHARSKTRNLMGVFVSRGVGVGLIMEGIPIRGDGGYSGEIGNTLVGEKKLDDVLYLDRITERIEMGEDLTGLDEILEMAVKDPKLEWVIDTLVDALENAVYILDPGLIVLLARNKLSGDLVESVNSKLKMRLDYPFNRSTRVEGSVLEDDPTVYGSAMFAVRMWMEEVLEV